MTKFIVFVIFLALAVIFIPWLQPRVNATPDHNATFVVDRDTYTADGQSRAMDVAPFVRNNRVYVPMRYLGHALGITDGDITWDSATRTVTFSRDGVAVRLTVDSALLSVGGQERTMDVTPILKDDRVFLPARWVAEAMGYEVKWDEASQAVRVGPPGNVPGPPAAMNDLPVVGTYENLKSLLARAQTRSGNRSAMKSTESFNFRQDVAATASKSLRDGTAAPAAAGDADYSGTNVQVEGVDEADIVKTDGRYIYQVNRKRVVISEACPAGDMKITSILDFTEKEFSPREMYVDDRRLVVIGQSRKFREIPANEPMPGGSIKRMPGLIPPYHLNTVKAILYDIADRSNVKKVRELELDGRYVSSRKIGPSLYLVAGKSIYYYPERESADLRPAYRDTAVGDGFEEIDYPEIRCFPDFVTPNYLVVAGLNLDRPDEKANINTYLGSGENIYASSKNLYVAVTGYRSGLKEDGPGLLPEPRPVDKSITRVYKFAMNDGQLTYAAAGEVPGTVLNQFSMDEHNGYFRVATTKGDVWRTDEHTSENNVYVLDGKLTITGKIENIAPGEKIYSVRFMGDRGYMVTFKTVDPFFVIDLKDPRCPSILGALKIPGYSDYLHPYDENHVIGFGKDTIELGAKDGEGNETGSMAFYTGMKMAIFDVSDVGNPVEVFREKIGGRGTDSELLRNHRALLFSREKNLLAFPVTVMETEGKGEETEAGFPQYGRFTFQGAYVYNVDLTGGFVLKGRITHLSSEDCLKAGNYWYDSDKNVNRIIYIDNVLYTLSNQFIKANDLNDLAEINTLEIK
ncbi:MAG: beta-propeller domain-containing protein [Firmicutes bacterium]|nr:beta-propeller domain-containing protein [Bacillota bacterium]